MAEAGAAVDPGAPRRGRTRARDGGDRRSGPTDGCRAAASPGSATGSRSCDGGGAKPDAPTSGPIVWVIQDVVDGEKLGARLERLAALGVDEVVVAFDTVDEDEILPVLDRYEKVIAANAG